jgi:glucose-6-phosphate isomerase
MMQGMQLKVVTSGTASAAVDDSMGDLISQKIASRIANKDATVWGKDAEAESSIRLGWVSSARDSISLIESITSLRVKFSNIGVSRFVLCGMGGSSLAPELITKTYGVELVVLDSTNPDQISAALAVDLSSTAVVVSSKSGSTVETDSQKRAFEAAFANAGIDPKERIVIVTDPGSPMQKAATADGYQVFESDPTVGGRYSALTAFGLVPSGLAGVDVAELLSQANSVMELLSSDSIENPALILGAALARTPGEMGFRDKIGIVEDGTSISGIGDWIEQLVAESTGKLGKGILPVVLDLNCAELNSGLADLVAVHIQHDAKPVAGDSVSVSGTLGAQLLLWEYATAIACYLLEVNPFDQPDVESAKIAARAMLERMDGPQDPDVTLQGIGVSSLGFNASGNSIKEVIASLTDLVDSDLGYLSIHAYLDRAGLPEALSLRDKFANKLKRPVTFGWAPRFLHSTGQYHKGGPKQGVFLQLVSVGDFDLDVPGREFTFGQLIASQAAGDAKVLSDLGRPVLTLILQDPKNAIHEISKAI